MSRRKLPPGVSGSIWSPLVSVTNETDKPNIIYVKTTNTSFY
jgi:hypothetical protein